MSEPVESPECPEPAIGRSPHSGRTIALRILGAVLIAVIALTVDRIWLRDEPARDTFGAIVRTKEIRSGTAVLDRAMPVKIVVPKGAPPRNRSLVVFLHGRGEDERSYLVDPMFEALADLRTRAPVIAFPYGGESSYWHNRDSGNWGTYVLAELIPELIARYDIDPDKVAIGGISMGGFGAYDIARLDPGRFCAVGGHSPAIWENAGEPADGAFDDAADFDRNNIIAIADSASHPFTGLKLWLDAGDDDPFLDGDRAFEDAVRAAGGYPVVKSSAGGHDSGYWNGNWAEYLGWYAHVLGNCGSQPEANGPSAAAAKPEQPSKPGGAARSRGSQRPSKLEAPQGAGSAG